MADRHGETEFGVLGAEEALGLLDEIAAVLAGSLGYESTLEEVARLTVPDLADWCAVDVVQEDGTLRQITSGHDDPEQEELLRILRKRYRATSGRNEGVTRVVRTGEPELFADVRGAERSRVEVLDEEAAVYERLAPRSYLIVPLVARGRTIGALTLLSLREGRHYSERDLAFSMHLARRFALAVDNARLYDAAERSLGQLDTFFASAPVGLAFYDTDLRQVRVNEPGRVVDDLSLEHHLRWVIREREPLLGEEVSGVDAAGDTRHWVVSYTPVLGLDGQVIGVGVVVIDVTDQRRALEAEREARRRATFLAEVGAVLDESLDFEQTIASVARLAVPDFADWCTVDVLDEDGGLRQVAVAHADPAKVRWAEELAARYPIDPESPRGVPQVIRSGEPLVVNDVEDAMLASAAADDEHLRLLQELGVTATALVPLQSRGRTFGALSFVSTESARRFDAGDLELFTELGRRAGVAVENARLYTERSRIAHSLQARLLPQRLPEPEGMRLAARYRAAGTYNEVGGDFYDAFDRAPGEWVVVIGDVSGKGPEAAALTAVARYTIRAAALNDWSPVQVLQRLNEALLHEEAMAQFITVALAFVHAVDEGVEVRLVLAGHPPPFVLRADGTAEQIGEPGTLLGMRPEIRLTEVQERLAPGDTMLLYTDGVIEAGPRGNPIGEDGLAALLAPLVGSTPERLVDAIERAAVEAAPASRARDDVALVAVHATGPAVAGALPSPIELTVRARPENVQELREAAVAFARTIPGMDVDGVRLAVSEAVSNAVIHAYRSDDPGTVRLRAEAVDGRLVVEVTDEGGGLMPRPDSPGMGLGLPLMAKLTRELEVMHPEQGGTTVRLVF